MVKQSGKGGNARKNSWAWGNEISVICLINKIKTNEQEMKDSKLLTQWPKITNIKQKSLED